MSYLHQIDGTLAETTRFVEEHFSVPMFLRHTDLVFGMVDKVGAGIENTKVPFCVLTLFGWVSISEGGDWCLS